MTVGRVPVGAGRHGPVVDISAPFIGSEALAAGALSRHELRTYYRAVLPAVYADKRAALTLRRRTVAAWLWSGREAVIAGSAASALHGADWVADDAPIELIWPNARAPRQVITRHDLLLDGELQQLGGMTVTTVHRTAFDLGRRGRIGEAVARLDALIRATGLAPADVRAVAGRHRHTRGLRQLERALELADGGAQSPKETWLRLIRPATQSTTWTWGGRTASWPSSATGCNTRRHSPTTSSDTTTSPTSGGPSSEWRRANGVPASSLAWSGSGDDFPR